MEIGLFPLGLVLLPGEHVPLHIFEPRYRELIAESIDHASPFGILLSDGDRTREIGTTALVVQVLERYEDGRLDIVVEGQERFRVVHETTGRSFLTAEIELVPDTDDPPSGEERARCVEAFRALATEAETETEDVDPGEADPSYWIAMRVDFGPDAKQELLEECSARARVTSLLDMLTRARTTMAWTKTAAERASTNGRVEPPG